VANLHIQAAIRIYAKTASVATTRIKQALGWNAGADPPPPPGRVVMSRALRGQGLHTWHGMIGYCMKDHGQAHFVSFFKGVSQDDIDRGQHEYAKYGAGPLKNRAVLTAQNLFHRTLIYWLYVNPDRRVIDLEQVLRDMLRTGKYYPAAAWVTPHQGRGMVPDRARALWEIMREPHLTSLQHVRTVFFDDTHNQHARTRFPRYFEEPDQHPSAGQPALPIANPTTATSGGNFPIANDNRPFIERFNEAAATRAPQQQPPAPPLNDFVPLG
jgi:hypothetical protein